VILSSIKKEIILDKVILTAHITSGKSGLNEELFFSYPARFSKFIAETADPFLPALLIPCMLYNEELEILPPLSAQLYDNQFILQGIFYKWHTESLSKVKVVAKSLHNGLREKSGKNASFFSMGVDSTYTMLKYLPKNNPSKRKELTHLVFMKGLELPLSIYTKGQDAEVIDAIGKIASHYQIDFIVGETNIRDVFPIDYEKYYFGPCLASVALSLSNGFDHMYIPSSNSYADIWPDPSTPLTDPLWSTEGFNIVHDGSEKDRAEKITDLIANDQYALDNLRVCVNNEGGIYNCCTCFKCVRTMVTLEIIDKLKDSRSFPKPLPKNFAKELRTYKEDNIDYAIENLKLAKKFQKKHISRTLEREIMVGRIDALRKGGSMFYLLKIILKYFFIKFRYRIVRHYKCDKH
jgi:hypothetical protein